jgi:DNA-binding response OmpR family regulator
MKKRPLILVVDDDETLLNTVHDTLVVEGFRVIGATGAVEALFLLAKRNPDLVLLDIMMPEYDGFQALEMVRHYSNIPVIMLTCLDDQSSLKRAMGDGGADDYITKPFNSRVLAARIKAKLRRTEGTSQHRVSAATHYRGNIGDDD